jgi:hypothetical protein
MSTVNFCWLRRATCHLRSIKHKFNGRAAELNYLKPVADRIQQENNMKNMIKFIVIAAAVAGSASSALAEETHHHAYRSKVERYGDAQLSEGRNSSRWWGYSNTSTDRESIVEAPAN